MPADPSFASWLGRLVGQSEFQVRRLLSDESALHFLVAWSLFEAKCFGGYMKAEDIASYAKVASITLDASYIQDIAAYFHARYQTRRLFKNLMHQQVNDRLSALRQRPYAELTAEDRLFFTAFVVYRYRNNIFHGNKGVVSWLQYREQIHLCIRAMQIMISHAEQIAPTMNTQAA